MARRWVHKIQATERPWVAECSGCPWITHLPGWYLAFRYAVAHVCGPVGAGVGFRRPE